MYTLGVILLTLSVPVGLAIWILGGLADSIGSAFGWGLPRRSITEGWPAFVLAILGALSIYFS